MAAFLFDQDANQRVGRRLAAGGHAVTSLYALASQAGLHSAGDREVLLHAALLGLILVTHNTKDFVALHDAGDQSHAGVLALEQVPPNAASMAADAVEEPVGSQPTRNELYRWRRRFGWERRIRREWVGL